MCNRRCDRKIPKGEKRTRSWMERSQFVCLSVLGSKEKLINTI